MKKLINEIKLLFSGMSKFRIGFNIVFFFYPLLSFHFFGVLELDYLILGLFALFSVVDIFMSYKLIKSLSFYIEIENKIESINENKTIILSKIESLWNLSKNLSIVLFMLLITSLIIIQKDITGLNIIFSLTWMMYVITDLYYRLLTRTITSYRIYEEE